MMKGLSTTLLSSVRFSETRSLNFLLRKTAAVKNKRFMIPCELKIRFSPLRLPAVISCFHSDGDFYPPDRVERKLNENHSLMILSTTLNDLVLS